MNSRYVMIASAAVTAVLGLAASFFPQELLAAAGILPSAPLLLIMQLAGALYFGFALMNWMAKDTVIGGIYARPLALGNFAHFMIAAIALLKAATSSLATPFWWVLAIIYLVFAVLFGLVAFTNPAKRSVSKKSFSSSSNA